MAWNAWPGPPGDPATPVNRVDVIAVAVILAGLPWVGRQVFGPTGPFPAKAGQVLARPGRPDRVVRAGGYAAVLILVLVKAPVERLAYTPPSTPQPGLFWVGEVVFLLVMIIYASWILAVTSPRLPVPGAAAAPAVLAGAGAALVAYVLGPLGFPPGFTGAGAATLYDALLALGTFLVLGAPAAVGLAAARRAVRQDSRLSSDFTPGEQGAIAGLTTGITAALVVTVLGTATIALLPHDPGLLQWAMAHRGPFEKANFGHGSQAYAESNSAYAWGYLIVLIGGPLLGAMLGALGSCAGLHAARRPEEQSPAGMI
jgi:hypothetical protein